MNADHNEILIISTPSGKSVFHDMFLESLKKAGVDKPVIWGIDWATDGSDRTVIVKWPVDDLK